MQKNIIYNMDGRQAPYWLYIEVKPSDVAKAVAGLIEIESQQNSELIDGFVNVREAFTGTTNTLTIGDAGNAARYHAAIDLKTVGLTKLTPTGYVYGADGTYQKLSLQFASTGTPTGAGKVRIGLGFLRLGKAYSAQG